MTAARRVLCFGDSNTWGYDPATGGRFAREVRWTGVLARALGPGVEVIEEGLNGRTTVRDDPLEAHRNGMTYLLPCLESHAPLDLVLLMLGTNDLKARFALGAREVADGARRLANAVRASGSGPGGAAPHLLLVAPPPVRPRGELDEMFAGAAAKSRDLAVELGRVAAARRCPFFDSGTVAVAGRLDGLHLEAEGHRALALALVPHVRALLG
jgi:lysophospholipase L1-like esterase